MLTAFGERLRAARLRRKLTTTAVAQRAGISRTTLYNAEAGDPGATLGTYVRILAALGLDGDINALASDDKVGRRLQDLELPTRRQRKPNGIPSGHHAPQDQQSLMMHKEAVRMLRDNPALTQNALSTLERWRSGADPRSFPLMDEWRRILLEGDWDSALEETERGNQLRQASPLSTLLPNDVRLNIISEVKNLKLRGAKNGQA